MAANSGIQWTNNTHNFWEGCDKVDGDCKYCYAERLFVRLGKDFNTMRRTKGFNKPLSWHEPRMIFTCSTSDFFHAGADEWRGDAWDVIRKCPQHTWQILTKRPERILECLPEYWEEIRGRVWLGTSIGSMKSIDRLYDLILPIQPGVKFLSLEPLHGPVDLLLNTKLDAGHEVRDLVDWVIVGGESGNEVGKHKYRPCDLMWIEDIVIDCMMNRVPVFVKQLGTHLAKELGLKDRHGGDMEEWPETVRVREFPRLNGANATGVK